LGQNGSLYGLSPTEQIKKMFSDMYFGNGKPGVVTRLDRLEGAVEKIVSYSRWVILLVVALCAKEVLLKIFTGKW
jgi:hypothetical protein